jgi:hypothetical protein
MAGLDGCGKSRPPPGFDPRTVQLIASRYTDYDIPAHERQPLLIVNRGTFEPEFITQINLITAFFTY